MRQVLIFCCLLTFPISILAQSLFIIGNKSSFHEQMSLKEIRAIYLVKMKQTATGQKIIPINLPANHKTRDLFSHAVFDKDIQSLADYWNRMSFRGASPPLIQFSEKSLELFVNRIKGAIGYMISPPDDNKVFIIKKIKLAEQLTIPKKREEKL